jgi:uncharacterized protein (TIGR00299 family) protein
MKIAYIQSIGGASGDMLLGALLDAGLSLDTLRQELSKLGVAGYDLLASQETRCEVRGTKLTVDLGDSARYSPQGLLDVVSGSSLAPAIKEKAQMVLTSLWEAEGRVHGESQDVLELEELGSVDTLVDVVGVVLGLDHLGVTEVYASPIILGAPEPPRWPGGYATPAPATLQLVARSGAPVVEDRPIFEGAGELTTPTGAALITTLASFQRPAMSITGVGVGLGSKDPQKFPNVLRLWLGEVAESGSPDKQDPDKQDNVILLETNLDDVPGMVLGYTQERLFDLGALDVWYTQVQMKKNRPGIILSALVPDGLEAEACRLIMRETPTLGIRTRRVERYVAERVSLPMETQFGVVSVKVKSLGGRPVGAAPEFEDCRRIALAQGLSFQEVYQQATAQAREEFLD